MSAVLKGEQTRAHVSKYLEVINQVERLLIKACLYYNVSHVHFTNFQTPQGSAGTSTEPIH